MGVAPAWAQPPGMVLVPAGEFQAGSGDYNDERPVHTVYLDEFYIDVHEVVQKDFEKVMGSRPSDFKDPNRPVERVTWYEARDYCKKTGKRLPTEAEWEKAARAGSDSKYYWGEAMDDAYAWHWDNSDRKTHAPGLKKPNAYGLYDMAGNVWEWVSDWYGEDYYQNTPKENPQGPWVVKYRALKGGSWMDLEEDLRTWRRKWDLPTGRFLNFG
ncbi:MAG: SUMF1/EgtB/PvdO family nonheme iron enzyme, partial [bacterium]